MSINKADSEKMGRLAQEGKNISDIVAEDFPDLAYWDVYIEVYGAGERSSLGIKRMITNRLNSLVDSPSRRKRREIAEELHGLVWHLYNNHKTNTEKLARIRTTLGE